MNIDPTWGLWGLFLSALISSTLFPGGSEAVLLWLASQGGHDPGVLLLIATVGNTVGGMTSWALGRLLVWRYPTRFQASAARQRALARLQRWGSPLLLLSWVPILGDPLCVAAGWLRVRWWLAAFYIAAGKAARYALLLALIH